MPAQKVRTAHRRRHTGRPGGLGLRGPRRTGRSAPPARNAAARCTPTRWSGRCRSGSAATAAPVHVDLDFFDGRKGGHMSIAGISGVATKTSFALFFLRVLTASPDVVGESAANLRVLVFNVKGEDLLWLDKPNSAVLRAPTARPRAGRRSASRRRRSRACGSGRPRDGVSRDLIPDTGGRLEGIDVFAWTPREFIDLGLLEFCFTDANDAKNQLPFIRERVQQQLQRFAVDVEGRPGAVTLRDPRDQPDGRWRRSDPRRARPARSSPTSPRWWRSSRRSWIPTTASPIPRGPVACSSRRSRRSCDGCTRPRRGSATSCAPASSTGSTATRRT